MATVCHCHYLHRHRIRARCNQGQLSQRPSRLQAQTLQTTKRGPPGLNRRLLPFQAGQYLSRRFPGANRATWSHRFRMHRPPSSSRSCSQRHNRHLSRNHCLRSHNRRCLSRVLLSSNHNCSRSLKRLRPQGPGWQDAMKTRLQGHADRSTLLQQRNSNPAQFNLHLHQRQPSSRWHWHHRRRRHRHRNNRLHLRTCRPSLHLQRLRARRPHPVVQAT